jgi:hypothetical protein
MQSGCGADATRGERGEQRMRAVQGLVCVLDC